MKFRLKYSVLEHITFYFMYVDRYRYRYYKHIYICILRECGVEGFMTKNTLSTMGSSLGIFFEQLLEVGFGIANYYGILSLHDLYAISFVICQGSSCKQFKCSPNFWGLSNYQQFSKGFKKKLKETQKKTNNTNFTEMICKVKVLWDLAAICSCF